MTPAEQIRKLASEMRALELQPRPNDRIRLLVIRKAMDIALIALNELLGEK